MLELTLTLLVFLFPLAYSPGPGNMFFAANGARFGLKATWPANIGYHIATWIVTVAIGFGFLAAMEISPFLFDLIKYAGAGYVLYLAWRFYHAGTLGASEQARPAGCADGAALLLLNPKAYLIITLMFTQFLGEMDASRITAVVWISTVFTFNNLIAFLTWTIIGDRLTRQFRDDVQAQRLNFGFAAILALVAIWMVAS